MLILLDWLPFLKSIDTISIIAIRFIDFPFIDNSFSYHNQLLEYRVSHRVITHLLPLLSTTRLVLFLCAYSYLKLERNPNKKLANKFIRNTKHLQSKSWFYFSKLLQSDILYIIYCIPYQKSLYFYLIETHLFCLQKLIFMYFLRQLKWTALVSRLL